MGSVAQRPAPAHLRPPVPVGTPPPSGQTLSCTQPSSISIGYNSSSFGSVIHFTYRLIRFSSIHPASVRTLRFCRWMCIQRHRPGTLLVEHAERCGLSREPEVFGYFWRVIYTLNHSLMAAKLWSEWWMLLLDHLCFSSRTYGGCTAPSSLIRTAHPFITSVSTMCLNELVKLAQFWIDGHHWTVMIIHYSSKNCYHA